MTRVHSLAALAFVVAFGACGGREHATTPKDPFDAKALAADLNGLTSEMADAATAPDLECSVVVTKIGEIAQRGRPLVERAREAQLDPEHAKQLTRELHVYDNLAVGRPDAIARRLAVCSREHPELAEQIQHVVDSLPTL